MRRNSTRSSRSRAGDETGVREGRPAFISTLRTVAAQNISKKAYQLLFKAMEESGYAAIAKLSMHQRTHRSRTPARQGHDAAHDVLYKRNSRSRRVRKGGLIVRAEARREKFPAEQLIESLAAPFEPDKYKDQYRSATKAMIEAKQQWAWKLPRRSIQSWRP